MKEKIIKTDTEWQAQLDDEQFRICRKHGTEAPFTGKYYANKDEGIYRCACCGEPLFASETKYDSGSGWPSFYAPLQENVIAENQDVSHNMTRTEIHCARCDCHLGHVFPDGPRPTGLRYCINSASLEFETAHKETN